MLLQLVKPAFARRLKDYRCIVTTMQTRIKKPARGGQGEFYFLLVLRGLIRLGDDFGSVFFNTSLPYKRRPNQVKMNIL